MKFYKINHDKIMIHQNKKLDKNQKIHKIRLVQIIKRWRINLKSNWNKQLKKLNKIMMPQRKSLKKIMISLRKNQNQTMN